MKVVLNGVPMHFLKLRFRGVRSHDFVGRRESVARFVRFIEVRSQLFHTRVIRVIRYKFAFSAGESGQEPMIMGYWSSKH